jgi:hypothetical protein
VRGDNRQQIPKDEPLSDFIMPVDEDCLPPDAYARIKQIRAAIAGIVENNEEEID